MKAVKAYIDTNVFVYLYSDTEPEKRKRALESINKYDRIISTQVLNELCNVFLRKMKMSPSSIDAMLHKILSICKISLVEETTVFKALEIHDEYGYSYYDSLMIASALENDCQYLLSEDMADGQVIENKLTIKNIFAD